MLKLQVLTIQAKQLAKGTGEKGHGGRKGGIRDISLDLADVRRRRFVRSEETLLDIRIGPICS